MYHSMGMCVGQPGANLLQIKKRPVERQLAPPAHDRQISAAEILEHDVVKRIPGKIDGRAVTQTIDYVRMPYAVEGHCLVLKVFDQGALKLSVRHALKQNV